MTKKIMAIGIAVTMLFAVLGFAGCNRSTQDVFAWYEGLNGDGPLMLVMNAGDTLTITDRHFRDTTIKFESFRLESREETREDVVSIRGNVITAVNTGYTRVVALLHQGRQVIAGQRTRQVWGISVAFIYVYDESTMTHITTAEELAGINNNLDGHFILMADIDLGNWGEWKSIGGNAPYGASWRDFIFRGMFVNPHGYTIKNLTVTTSETKSGDIAFGLFGDVSRNALISGIILEDVFIDVSDFEGHISRAPQVGGIAVSVAPEAMIFNCFVSGVIIGGGYVTGGIVGTNGGSIVNCTFKGTLKVDKLSATHNIISIGGIVGYNGTGSLSIGGIRGCRVYAIICGGETAAAGGIIGFQPMRAAMTYCSAFDGSVSGRFAGTMIGRARLGLSTGWEDWGSIDF